MLTLWAVHLSDGVLETPWWVAGWLLAVPIIAWASRRVDDEELPRLGVLSSAFFVASQIHLPLGGVSVHLLLNGLVGVLLRRRAPLAIAVGLFLQALLFGHGGWSTLGLNFVIYTLPALLAGWGFPHLISLRLVQSLGLRRAIVALLVWLWLQLATFALHWMLAKLLTGRVTWSPDWLTWWNSEPLVAGSLALLALGLAWFEPKLEPSPGFPLGLLLGAMAGLLSVGLNAAVLALGCKPEFQALPGVVLLIHQPVIAVESITLGFVVVFLLRVRPEWLGLKSATG